MQKQESDSQVEHNASFDQFSMSFQQQYRESELKFSIRQSEYTPDNHYNEQQTFNNPPVLQQSSIRQAVRDTPQLGKSLSHKCQRQKRHRSSSEDSIRMIQHPMYKSANLNVKNPIDPSISIISQPQLLKEGYVYKKSANKFVGWQKRFLQLYENKLIYLSNPNHRQRVKGSINLISYECQCQWDGKELIWISLSGIKRTFQFKTSEGQSWFNQISRAINAIQDLNHFSQIPRLKSDRKKHYLKKDIISELEFKSQCSTGDIFVAKTLKSSVFSLFESSDNLDMVFIVIKEQDQIYLGAQADKGLMTIKYEDFLDDFGPIIELSGLRRLHFINKTDLMSNIDKTLANISMQGTGKSKRHSCVLDNSKLLLEFYKQTGILQKKAKLSNTPSNFLKLIKVNSLKNEIYPTCNGAWFSHVNIIYPQRHQDMHRYATEF